MEKETFISSIDKHAKGLMRFGFVAVLAVSMLPKVAHAQVFDFQSTCRTYPRISLNNEGEEYVEQFHHVTLRIRINNIPSGFNWGWVSLGELGREPTYIGDIPIGSEGFERRLSGSINGVVLNSATSYEVLLLSASYDDAVSRAVVTTAACNANNVDIANVSAS